MSMAVKWHNHIPHSYPPHREKEKRNTYEICKRDLASISPKDSIFVEQNFKFIIQKQQTYEICRRD